VKKPVHRALYLEDILHTLQEMERTCSEVENSDALQALTTRQRADYRAVLSRLRYLIRDLEQDAGQEQLAS